MGDGFQRHHFVWAIVGAAVIMGAAIWGARGGDGHEQRPTTHPAPTPAAHVEPPGSPLAPGGYAVRDLDAVPGRQLHLGLTGPSRRSRACTVGSDRADDPLLAEARCEELPPDAPELPPERGPTDALDLGDATLSLERGSASDTLVVAERDGETRRVVGTAPSGSSALRACRSSESIAVVVEGPLADDGRDVLVAFRGADGWSALASERAGAQEPALTCRGDEAALTWIEPVDGGRIPIVHQVRCRPGACEAAESRLSIAGTDAIAVDLAGRALVAWSASDGTRLRLAPLTELADAADITHVHDPALHVIARRLFVRGGAAVLTLQTDAGTYGLRIDTTARVTPLPVE